MGSPRVYDVGSHRVTILLDAAATGGAIGLVEIAVPPGSGPLPHIHGREDETYHVLEGEVVFTVDGERHVVRAGGTAFGPRGIPHEFHNEGAETARLLVAVTPGGFEEYFAECGTPAAPDRPPARPSPDLLMRLIGNASRYGITFVPPAR